MGYWEDMEPLPETARAIADFGPFAIENEDLLVELLSNAQHVVDLVPACVGISLTSNLDEVTFTVVATATEVALLDAIQYVGGGPYEKAVEVGEPLVFDTPDPLDEDEWQLFAQATSAASVASTLTLPILHSSGRGAGSVAGSVNLYASTPDAFDGRHEAIAEIFDAWAPGAIINADLSFTTRGLAEAAPDQLRGDIDLTIACNVIAAHSAIPLEDARRRLNDAARRAGVSEAQLAHAVVELQRLDESD